MMLPDVQASRDGRNMPVDEVGISGIRYPVAVADREHGKQDTVAEVSMSVDLPAGVKGTHLSRFVEILHETADEVTLQAIPAILDAIRERLGASRARLEVSFPFFLRRAAPVTGAVALMDYQCSLAGELAVSGTRVTMGVRVPVTSVCPCSKAISDYGAHNQRAIITICASPREEEEGQLAEIWAEDLIETAEAAASSPVFALLKRPDERHVTMHAHDHPVFVEDMVRDVAEALGSDERISCFAVEAASEESIHNHRAFARIQSPAAAGDWTLRQAGGMS
jgi:GTP cyclohydrolase I